jgi:hypothetical protein
VEGTIAVGIVGLVLTGAVQFARRKNPDWSKHVPKQRLDWLLGVTAAGFVSALTVEVIR